jgi:aryl-alcohol dehydrogenase-like predicted oxidoreductase
MRYRKIGRHPLEVSEISFGTGDNAGGLVYGSSEQQRALVEAALELGINLFDCSPDYGKGAGEVNLGRLLQDFGARDAKIITKVEIMAEDFDRIAGKVADSIDDSLLRLRREKVDIVMLHNPIRFERNAAVRRWMRLTPDDVLDAVLPALVRAREAGKCDYLGLACESSDPAAVAPVMATGEIALINAWFNLTNPTAARAMKGYPEQQDYNGLFALVEKHGAAVSVIRPLAGGALTDAFVGLGTAARHDLSRGFYRENPTLLEPEIERARRFEFLRREGEQTLSMAAYRYALSFPVVATIVGGFSDLAQLRDAVAASRLGPLSGEELEAVERIHADGFQAGHFGPVAPQ